MATDLAPIALFVYNRAEHARKTLLGLMRNAEFSRSTLYVFCDGPRNEQDRRAVMQARDAIRSVALRNTVLVEQDCNQGLAKAIVAGVSLLCAQHGRVIVVEDDLMVSRCFLGYMNSALNLYTNSERVMQIVGHCVQAPEFWRSTGSGFLPFTSSLGWATWARAWRYYDDRMTGFEAMVTDRRMRNAFNLDGAMSYTRMYERLRKSGRLGNSWALRWYWSVFKAGGIALFPHRTLVDHFGDDGSGTNVAAGGRAADQGFDECNCVDSFPKEPEIERAFFESICRTIRRQQSPFSKGARLLRSVVRRYVSGRGDVRDSAKGA